MTITLNVEICKGENKSFEEIVADVYELAMKFGRDLVVQILEGLDRDLMENRDSQRYRCKGKQKTSVKTMLGTIEYCRNVYNDLTITEGIHHIHLLDEVLGIEKIGLVAKEVCELAAGLICEQSFRATAKTITDTTGLSISAQGVWNIVQDIGERREAQIERHAELAEMKKGVGTVATDILYEENDGVWLHLQGNDRKEFGKDKEMKVGIAYDGAVWQDVKGGNKRRTLDCKVAHASFEPAKKFRKSKEGVISSQFDVPKVKLRVLNGDGANWIQPIPGVTCIRVLDEYHRNRKLQECVTDEAFLQTAKSLLYAGKVDELLTCIQAQIESTEDETERAKLQELLRYYTENKSALLGYYDRGIEIPETREPGVIHHARLGSMESNIFTLIGNRMKDRRSCWSIDGANHLASILCLRHTTGFDHLFSGLSPLPEPEIEDTGAPFSAAQIPESVGHGSECYNRATLPNIPWIKYITGYQSFTALTI